MSDFPNDEDGHVLARFAADGVELSRPRLIDFAVAAPHEQAAQQIAAAISKAGYEAEVYYDEGEPDEDGNIDPDDPEFGPSWTVYAKVQMALEHGRLVAIQAHLDRLATPFGGKADGWGTELEMDERHR
jgi:hypothetical protein